MPSFALQRLLLPEIWWRLPWKFNVNNVVNAWIIKSCEAKDKIKSGAKHYNNTILHNSTLRCSAINTAPAVTVWCSALASGLPCIVSWCPHLTYHVHSFQMFLAPWHKYLVSPFSHLSDSLASRMLLVFALLCALFPRSIIYPAACHILPLAFLAQLSLSLFDLYNYPEYAHITNSSQNPRNVGSQLAATEQSLEPRKPPCRTKTCHRKQRNWFLIVEGCANSRSKPVLLFPGEAAQKQYGETSALSSAIICP